MSYSQALWFECKSLPSNSTMALTLPVSLVIIRGNTPSGNSMALQRKNDEINGVHPSIYTNMGRPKITNNPAEVLRYCLKFI